MTHLMSCPCSMSHCELVYLRKSYDWEGNSVKLFFCSAQKIKNAQMPHTGSQRRPGQPARSAEDQGEQQQQQQQPQPDGAH